VSAFKPAPVKPVVSTSDLEKLDIRVGTILSVEEVPKSTKLLKLIADLGDHRRTVLAGMKAERANPQEIVGLQALFVVNLEPRRMAGEVSEGMLLDVGYADGVSPALCVPERPVLNGVRAG
jgi:methionine--tRNA ligase beta chain